MFIGNCMNNIRTVVFLFAFVGPIQFASASTDFCASHLDSASNKVDFTFSNDRIYVRPSVPEDVQRTIEIVKADSNEQMSGDILSPTVIEGIVKLPAYSKVGQNWRSLSFTIFDRQNHKVIGNVGIERGSIPVPVIHQRHVGEIPNDQVASLAFSLDAKYWSQGIMTQITEAIVPYCFRTLHLDLVFAFTKMGNIGSYRVLEKVGFLKVHQINDASGVYPEGTVYFEMKPEIVK